ncbi:hypothetical protein, partial [Fulvivirga marina]|uniref:hypothetical protein n=1 Tax=Fulvivirga marina TaxID=2494733 RepID=UPI001EE219E4
MLKPLKEGILPMDVPLGGQDALTMAAVAEEEVHMTLVTLTIGIRIDHVIPMSLCIAVRVNKKRRLETKKRLSQKSLKRKAGENSIASLF